MSTTTTGTVYVSELLLRDPPTYDEFTGMMQVRYRYRVGLPMEEALMMPFDQTLMATGPDQIQRVIGINKTLPTGANVPIWLVPVQRDVEEIQADHDDAGKPAQTLMTVTYEGHLCLYPDLNAGTTDGDTNAFDGIFSVWHEDSEQTERIVLSFDVDDFGNRIGIGPNNEGVNRSVPVSRLRVRQNISFTTYSAMRKCIQALLCKVCEEGWSVPRGGIAEEGEYLYRPPQIVENRDGTFTITHDFERDNAVDEIPAAIGTTTTGTTPSVRRGHKARYYDEKTIKVAHPSGIYKEVKTAFGEEICRSIYLVAGTHTAYKFADLFRSPTA